MQGRLARDADGVSRRRYSCGGAGTKAPAEDLFFVTTAAFASPSTGTAFIYQLDAYGWAPVTPTVGAAATYKYNTATDSWTTARRIPTLRALSSSEQGAMAATAASNIYVMGGGSPIGNLVPANRLKHEAYSPLADTWTTKANMPAGYVGGAIGVWDASPTTGTILVAGGYPLTTTMHIYNAATDAWRAGARATSAPGLGPRLQLLHRDWTRPCHICYNRTGLTFYT